MSASAHSLLPIPLSPRMRVPIPLMSSSVPCSDILGAKSLSSRTRTSAENSLDFIRVRMSGILCRRTASSMGLVGARLREITMHGISWAIISSITADWRSSGKSRIYAISPAPKSWMRLDAKFL